MKPSLFAVVLLASALGGGCLAQGAPAASNPPSAANAAVTTPKKTGYDPDAQICKWTETIGSRLDRHRICMTRAQWDQQSRDSQDEINGTERRADQMSPPGH